MDLRVFGLLLIAHFCGDIIFASYRLAVLKRSSALPDQILGLAGHCCIHAFLAGIFLILAGFPWIEGAVLVFVFHFLIDFVRSSVDRERFGSGNVYVKRSEFVAWISGRSENRSKMNLRNLGPWFMINLLDQGAHMASLLIIATFV
jgi:hypothetical protein